MRESQCMGWSKQKLKCVLVNSRVIETTMLVTAAGSTRVWRERKGGLWHLYRYVMCCCHRLFLRISPSYVDCQAPRLGALYRARQGGHMLDCNFMYTANGYGARA
jgi:hypothetical protein